MMNDKNNYDKIVDYDNEVAKAAMTLAKGFKTAHKDCPQGECYHAVIGAVIAGGFIQNEFAVRQFDAIRKGYETNGSEGALEEMAMSLAYVFVAAIHMVKLGLIPEEWFIPTKPIQDVLISGYKPFLH